METFIQNKNSFNFSNVGQVCLIPNLKKKSSPICKETRLWTTGSRLVPAPLCMFSSIDIYTMYCLISKKKSSVYIVEQNVYFFYKKKNISEIESIPIENLTILKVRLFVHWGCLHSLFPL